MRRPRKLKTDLPCAAGTSLRRPACPESAATFTCSSVAQSRPNCAFEVSRPLLKVAFMLPKKDSLGQFSITVLWPPIATLLTSSSLQR